MADAKDGTEAAAAPVMADLRMARRESVVMAGGSLVADKLTVNSRQLSVAVGNDAGTVESKEGASERVPVWELFGYTRVFWVKSGELIEKRGDVFRSWQREAKRVKERKVGRGTSPIVLAGVRKALKRKGVAAILREAVCVKCAQVEENTGFVFCKVKRGIVAA